jgi:hypothetical protein
MVCKSKVLLRVSIVATLLVASACNPGSDGDVARLEQRIETEVVW